MKLYARMLVVLQLTSSSCIVISVLVALSLVHYNSIKPAKKRKNEANLKPRVSIMEPKWRANQARGAVKRPFGEKYAFLMPLGVPCEPNNAISESFLGALSDLGSVLGAILTMLGGQSHEKWDQKSVWKSITNMLCQILKKWIEKYA